MNFFAYHGHIGLDIILMTQGIQSMSRMFNPLLEFIVKVKPRSKKIGKGFSYRYVDLKGRYMFTKTLKMGDRVFGAYKSFRQDERNKPKPVVLIWLVAIISVFILAGGVMAFAINSVKARGKRADVPVINVSPVEKDQPVAGVSPAMMTSFFGEKGSCSCC